MSSNADSKRVIGPCKYVKSPTKKINTLLQINYTDFHYKKEFT